MPLGQPPECQGCPLYGVGTGFVLGSGDPKRAKIGLFLEAPGREELTYDVDDAELERRRSRFPNLDGRFLKRGAPVVGKAGAALWQWGMAAVQTGRDTCFVDNGLRCLPPKGTSGPYPTGAVRTRAEAFCRQWDRWDEFSPTHTLVSIHPAAVVREPTPLPLMVKVIGKAKDLSEQGFRPLVLFGGKATQLWLGYASNVTRWVGHWQRETEGTKRLRRERTEEGLKVKEKKGKKLTVKGALGLFLTHMQPNPNGVWYCDIQMTEGELKSYQALLAPKEKK